jgi:hypothetical protein
MTPKAQVISAAILLVLVASVVWWFMGREDERSEPNASVSLSRNSADTPGTIGEARREDAPVDVSQDLESDAPPENQELSHPVRGIVLREDTREPVTAFQLAWLETVPGSRAQWASVLGDERTLWQSFESGDGTFILDGIPGGRSSALAARAEGFEPVYVTVSSGDLSVRPEAVRILLAPETAVAGRVVTSEGLPVPDAAICHGTAAERNVVARTDSEGQFRTTKVPGGEEIVLTAEHPDYLPRSVRVFPVPNTVEEVKFVLEQGGVIEGTVLCGTGAIPSAGVMVYDEGSFRRRTKTDAEGHFRIAGVVSGEVEVQVRAYVPGTESPRMLQRRAIVRKDATTIVDFRFSDASNSISGLVTVGGQPAPRGLVEIIAIGEGGDALKGARIAEGAYLIENLPPGEVWLETTAMGEDGSERSCRMRACLSAAEHLQQDIHFAGAGAIEGSVPNTVPSAPCTVLVLSGDMRGVLSGSADADAVDAATVASMPVADDGRFYIAFLEPGVYTVAAIVPGTELSGVQTAVVNVEEGKIALADFGY